MILCVFQAYGFAVFTEQLPGAVAHPGWAFRLTTVLTLTTGGVFVMWLGEQITERGHRQRRQPAHLLLDRRADVARDAPHRSKPCRRHSLSFPVLLIVLAVMVFVVAGHGGGHGGGAAHPHPDPAQGDGPGRIREGQKTFIPLRINSAGVMPIIFAQSLIIVPGTLATFSNNPALKRLAEYFNADVVGRTSSRSAVLIIFFAYFYTSIIFNPVDLAENLKKQGGFIPGVKPGAATADYIDEVLSRITLPGSLFLTVVALLPDRRVQRAQHAVRVRRHGAPDRGRRRAGHGSAGAAAPACCGSTTAS